MPPPEKAPPRVLVRATERGPDLPSSHPYNPRSEIHGWLLSRPAGLARVAVNLAWLPPGKESAILHAHHREEEWLFVLSGRGVAEVGERAHEVGPGDFLGFPPGVAHHLRNAGAEDLLFLEGGEVVRDVEVADFPGLSRRLVRFGARFAVYPYDAEVPFLPAEVQEAAARTFGMAAAGEPPRVLVRAAERAEEEPYRNPENPRSEIRMAPLGYPAGLTRVAVEVALIPPGKESFAFHLHHVEEEWMFVLSGRGIAEVGDAEHAIGPGDFLGFPAGGPAHHLRNPGAEDLVYLQGGDASRLVEVVDYPRLGKRKVRLGGKTAGTYPLE